MLNNSSYTFYKENNIIFASYFTLFTHVLKCIGPMSFSIIIIYKNLYFLISKDNLEKYCYPSLLEFTKDKVTE